MAQMAQGQLYRPRVPTCHALGQPLWYPLGTHHDLQGPKVQIGIFVDDKTISARSREGWKQAMQVTSDFDIAVGHTPNISKTKVLASIKDDRIWLTTIQINQYHFTVVTDAKSLGTLVTTRASTSNHLSNTRLQGAKNDALKYRASLPQGPPKECSPREKPSQKPPMAR